MLAIFFLFSFFFKWDDGGRVRKGKNGVISKSTGLKKMQERKRDHHLLDHDPQQNGYGAGRQQADKTTCICAGPSKHDS